MSTAPANAGSVAVKSGKDQNVTHGLEMIESIRADITSFIASEEERGETFDGRVTSLEAALEKMEARFRQYDDELPAGKKNTAEVTPPSLEEAFTWVGKTMHASYKAYRGEQIDREMFKADMAGDTQGGGGAQIPTFVNPELTRWQAHASLPRRLFNTIQMQGRAIDFPVLARGPVVYWPGEGQSPWSVTANMDATHPPIPTAAPAGPAEIGFTGQGGRFQDPSPQLQAKMMMAVDKISGEYLEDAVSNESLTAVIARLYVEAAAEEETRVALVGKFTAGPDPFNGITNTANVPSGGTIGASDEMTVEVLLAAMATIHETVTFAPRACFIINTKAFITKILSMSSTLSSALGQLYIHNFAASVQNPYSGAVPDPITGAPGLLMGRPCYLTPHLPDGTVSGGKWLIYGDMSRCWMGLRGGMSVDYSPVPFWTAGATGIRLKQRLGFLFPQPTALCTVTTT